MSTRLQKRAVSKLNAQLNQLSTQSKKYYASGEHEKALQYCLRAAKLCPSVGDIWLDAAVNCIKLERREEAAKYADKALKCGVRNFRLYDTLSHAYGLLKQWDKVREYGLEALKIREQVFASTSLGNLERVFIPLPEKPNLQTKSKNIIAFALFGGTSKYCETAVINVQRQPDLYPYWTCRFYVDETVPENIVERLKSAGAEIVVVADEYKKLPGPMWRFLVLADTDLHRVIFRDADSIISEREVGAVTEWVNSDKHFHSMRDSASHTELLLAGMWGAVIGALPTLSELLDAFLADPITSTRFADQYFLRQYVWPYVKQSLLQHDSVFGFLESRPFPDGDRREGFHVGCCEGTVIFAINSNFPEGTAVNWAFIDQSAAQGEVILCSYPARVRQGKVQDCIPNPYSDLLEQGKAKIVITERK